MNKSAYLDAEFCRFWEERSGEEGQVYKRYVSDPVLLGLLGELNGKEVLELGCGNGALARKLLALGVKHLTLMDLSPHNLSYAKSRCGEQCVTYICQDAAEKWEIEDESLDFVVSDMMLNEMEKILAPVRETYRSLRVGGRFVCSVFHPAFDLYVHAQEKAGLSQTKIMGVEGYFTRKFTKYEMGSTSKTSPELASKYNRDLSVQHFHRTIQDYFMALRTAGFAVTDLLEPEINGALLQAKPDFCDYLDRPVSLIFAAKK